MAGNSIIKYSSKYVIKIVFLDVIYAILISVQRELNTVLYATSVFMCLTIIVNGSINVSAAGTISHSSSVS